MVNELKLIVVHFPMQIYASTWIYSWTKETVENQDFATEPSRAVDRGPAFSKAPLIFDINKRILKYISHLQSKEQSSLVIQSLAMSLNLHRNDKTSFHTNLNTRRGTRMV